MRHEVFANNNFYHVFNRGVEKRTIFQNRGDYFRFMKSLYEFNDEDSTFNVARDVRSLASNRSDNFNGSWPREKKRKLLVNIVCFCLMPNHFHLILEQLRDNGISAFMHKLGTGYTKYFNIRTERVGSLFQGTFKAKYIERDEYLTHLSRYIHLNPVELIEPGWKEGEAKNRVKNWDKINKFLGKYRWSSYLDYIGKENFPSVIDNRFLMGYFDGSRDYKNFVNSWLAKDLEEIDDLIIE